VATEAKPAEAQLAQLEPRLELAGLKPAETIPLIAPLLNLPLSDKYPPSPFSPEQQRRRLLATLVEWVLGAARVQPLVVATEDLHWADPSTLELIQLLVEQGATARLLLLYTARPEFCAQWPPRTHYTQITLSRLSVHNTRAMVEEVAARKAMSDATIATVIERTGGVPLFVEELTRAVLESGGAGLTGRTIPVTLHDSLMARLDRLGPAKEVAQVGAVIGSEFPYELLHAVHPVAEEDLQRALRSLTDAELLYVRGIAPDATYQFKHALIRDAAYEALLKSRRRELHRLVARTIVDKFSALQEAHPEVLARHWTEAGETEQAILCWQQAGQRATQRLANVEAIAHLTKGLELLKAQPDTPERAQQELLLQLALGAPLIVTKSWASPEVGAVYTRTQELCRQIGGTPLLFQALEGLWLFHFNRGEFQSACGLAEQLLDLAQRQHDPAFLMGAHCALGTTLFRLGELVPAQEHLEKSIALANPQTSSPYAFSFAYDPRIGSLSYTVWNLWMLGYMDRALKRADETLTLAQELSHPFRLAFALIYNVRVHQLRREVQTTREQAEAVIVLGTEHGFTTATVGRIWKSWALVEQGHEEAIGQMRQGIAALRATGTSTLSSFLGLLAESCGKRGRTEEGLAAVTEALALVNETGERFWEAELHRLKGELTLKQSGIQRLESSIQKAAEECFQKAITIARRQRAKSLELRAVISLARLWQHGKKEEARRLLTEIYSWFTEGFDTKDLQEAKGLLEELS
jgi:tetratricopeptide (TPR) repeat protein